MKAVAEFALPIAVGVAGASALLYYLGPFSFRFQSRSLRHESGFFTRAIIFSYANTTNGAEKSRAVIENICSYVDEPATPRAICPNCLSIGDELVYKKV
jgi:hypothetical protein